MRIAIVALNAFPAVVPEAGRAVGGLETFAWSLARGLAAQSATQVQFLVRHTSQPTQNRIEGVELLADVEPLRNWRRDASDHLQVSSRFPWLKWKRFRADLLWKLPCLAVVRLWGGRPLPLEDRIEGLLKAAAPDVVLALGVGDGSAAAVSAARRCGIRSVLWIRSNADLNADFLKQTDFVDPHGATSSQAQASYGADAILCQTSLQQTRVRALLGRDSSVIRNPVDADQFPLSDQPLGHRQGVLWIGRFDRHHKRPELALEIARRCREIPFRMVINRGDLTVEEEIRAQAPPNVEIVDYLPRQEVSRAFRAARVFLSTGSLEFEGFPNVLLEAAASGTPIVSREDFDGFLTKSGSGITAAGAEQAAAAIDRLVHDDVAWQRCSQSGASYVRSEHTLQNCIHQVLEFLRTR